LDFISFSIRFSIEKLALFISAFTPSWNSFSASTGKGPAENSSGLSKQTGTPNDATFTTIDDVAQRPLRLVYQQNILTKYYFFYKKHFRQTS